MAYIDQYALSDDVLFRKRVRVAMLTTAKDVMAEDPGTANHAARATYAHAVLNNPDAYVVAFAQVICTNPVITGDSVDSDLLFTSNSLFDAMAGTGTA